MDNISIIILAAGQGTRMKSSKPKVLHEICGKSMLFHVIKQALEVSNDVIVVLAHQSELVQKHIENEFVDCMDKITCVLQDIKNFCGTAGAVRAAINSIKNEKVLISCADMPLVQADDFKNLCSIECEVVVGGFYLQEPFGYGRIITQNDKVLQIVEEKDANQTQKNIKFCNSGVYVFSNKILKEFLPKINNNNASKEFYLTDIIELAVKNNINVLSKELDGRNFMGVNDKYALTLAQDIMLDKIRQKWLKLGVSMHLPNTIYIDCMAEFQGECEIESNCVIKGKSIIKDSIIKSGSVIENSIIKNSDIGPNAHLRPNCQITNTHIGNFVELKNATLNGVKAGHLSYLGDCQIGANTNIGCGSITCNYDGVKKHKTIIGENVFVGSDVSLIAPVSIANNTIIAAGSVVTKSSQEGELILARAEQKNISGYFYKKFKKK